jgi:hypothetical protein
MGYFCEKCGADEYVCQVCGRICCSKEEPSTWEKITIGKNRFINGNMCPDCKKRNTETHPSRTIHFCPKCDEQIESFGWGNRVQCPNCNQWVTVNAVSVPVIKNQQGAVL